MSKVELPGADPARWERPARWEARAPWVCAVIVLAAFVGVLIASGDVAAAAIWAFFAGALSAPTVLAARKVARERRRSLAVRRWADAHGWSYDRRSGAVPRGGRDVLRTVLDGVAVSSYTAYVSVDMLSEAAPALRHAVAARVPADLPTLLVLPEAVPRRPGAAPLSPDIQFESAEFNARWRVHCADAVFAHAFCHPLVMERLMRPDAEGVSLFADGRDVVVHAPGPTELDAVESRAALAADLARLVPPYLVASHPPPVERIRRRTPENSRTAAVLGIALLAAWIAFLAPLGMAGEPGMAIVLGATPVVVLGFVILVGADPRRRRERAEKREGAQGDHSASS